MSFVLGLSSSAERTRLQRPTPPLMREPFFLEQPHLKEFDIQTTLRLPKKAMNLRVARVAEDAAATSSTSTRKPRSLK
ncbi:MAG: hypothetical protein M3R61_11850 [Chloroflexota bacterium]|nr:hypothetical protein [Chloroflexota bacterium]